MAIRAPDGANKLNKLKNNLMISDFFLFDTSQETISSLETFTIQANFNLWSPAVLFSLTSEAAIQILGGIDGHAQIHQGEGKPSLEAMIVEEDVDQAPEASTNWRTRCGM